MTFFILIKHIEVNFLCHCISPQNIAGALWPRTPIMLEGPRMLVAPLFHQASEFYMLITRWETS